MHTLPLAHSDLPLYFPAMPETRQAHTCLGSRASTALSEPLLPFRYPIRKAESLISSASPPPNSSSVERPFATILLEIEPLSPNSCLIILHKAYQLLTYIFCLFLKTASLLTPSPIRMLANSLKSRCYCCMFIIDEFPTLDQCLTHNKYSINGKRMNDICSVIR